MKLSNNFTLEEFLRSQTAARHGIDMTPPDWVLENLQRLVDGCLQPLRDQVKASVNVSSGFRPLDLNSLIGGSKTSEHINGNACDFTITGWAPFETSELIVELGLPFDQVIHEFGAWVHWGMADILRSEKLTAYKDARHKTRYTHGLHRIPDLS
jgi:zinc D-Ala-D-Ala carboxypeptidase